MELSELKSLFENALRTMTELVDIQSDSVLLDALSTDSDRARHREEFETNVAVGYSCINQSTHPNMLRCVVTNQFHPQDLVCKGAHLLAVSEKRALPLVGLSKSDLWDSRNGLCVLRTIHKRFEDKELVRRLVLVNLVCCCECSLPSLTLTLSRCICPCRVPLTSTA